jgi:hypothetical protein
MRRIISKKSTIAVTLAVAVSTAAAPASAQIIDWRRLAFRYNADGTRDTSFNTRTSNGGPEKILQTAPNGTGTGFFDAAMFGTSIVQAATARCVRIQRSKSSSARSAIAWYLSRFFRRRPSQGAMCAKVMFDG